MRRGDRKAGPEMPGEGGLVVEPGRDRAFRERPAPFHQAACRIDPDLGEQRIRGEPEFKRPIVGNLVALNSTRAPCND